jgi:hypothetical protein
MSTVGFSELMVKRIADSLTCLYSQALRVVYTSLVNNIQVSVGQQRITIRPASRLVWPYLIPCGSELCPSAFVVM